MASSTRRRHPFLLFLAVVATLLIAVAAGLGVALPQILSSPLLKPKLLAAVAPKVSPGQITVEKFEFSWKQPFVMHGFQLRDKDGTVVIESQRVRLSRNLAQLIGDPNDMGTMTFEKAEIDVRREEDGTINLVRALGSLISPEAEKDFAIVIRESTLKVNAPQLNEPFISRDADMLINLPKAPAPLSFLLDASSEGARKSKFSLNISGKIERWTDKSVDILAEFDRWPFAGSGMGLGATAWATGRVKITEGPDEYHIIPQIRADVRWSDSETLPQVVTSIDRLQMQSDIRASIEPKVNIALKGTKIAIPGVQLVIDGKAQDVGGAASAVDLAGNIALDPAKLHELTSANSAEPIEFEMTPVNFKISGPLAEKDRSKIRANLNTQVSRLKTGGISLGKMQISADWQNGRLDIAPIDTTINDGRLHLEPLVEMSPEGTPLFVRLGPNTTLQRMSLDTITSQKYMVYPAPALASATTVKGFISARISNGIIPITDKSRELDIKGDMAFEDVTFGPGPWLIGLTNSVGLPPPPTFALNQPIQFEILGDRVIQSGLMIPIGDLTRLNFSGSVSFKKELDLLVQVPVTPSLLANAPLVRSFLGQEEFKIPIRGTLDKPEVDKSAFDTNMKQLGENLK
ncbi:MAG: hypothetical protein ACKO85_14605, partial [Isosphaeraceae bacterium]